MSEYEEVIEIIKNLSHESEMKSYELLQTAAYLERFSTSFSEIINGTSDLGINKVYSLFIKARKELLKAAKALMLAAKAGYDWSENGSSKLVKKRVRR